MIGEIRQRTVEGCDESVAYGEGGIFDCRGLLLFLVVTRPATAGHDPKRSGRYAETEDSEDNGRDCVDNFIV